MWGRQCPTLGKERYFPGNINEIGRKQKSGIARRVKIVRLYRQNRLRQDTLVLLGITTAAGTRRVRRSATGGSVLNHCRRLATGFFERNCRFYKDLGEFVATAAIFTAANPQWREGAEKHGTHRYASNPLPKYKQFHPVSQQIQYTLIISSEWQKANSIFSGNEKYPNPAIFGVQFLLFHGKMNVRASRLPVLRFSALLNEVNNERETCFYIG
jgi:hypothetical protein